MENKKIDLKKAIILISFSLIGYCVVSNLQTVGNIFNFIFNILFPFILGGALAFILNIPMSFFENKMKKIKNKKLLRTLSLILAVIVILLVFVIVITLIVPELIKVVNLLIENIPYYTEQINNFISNSEINIPDIKIDTEGIKNQIISQLPSLLTFSISLVANVVGAISTFFIAIIFAFYILVDKERIQMQVTKLLKAYLNNKKVDKLINIVNVINNVFKKFFTVQCLEATILGVLCIIGMLILRLPYAVPIGVLIGVTALIPVIGAFIGIGIGVILILCVDSMKAIAFVVFVLILQQIEGNLIYPKVVGKSVGLPEMWVLVAVTIGGSVGGILGMLLGVPIATTIYNLLKTDIDKKIDISS